MRIIINKLTLSLYISLFMVGTQSFSSSNHGKMNSNCEIDHGIVFYQEGKYAGWPANNGIWVWGDEILVGFVESEHKDLDGLHTYDRHSGRNKYARSLDGGKTWSIEDAYEAGQTAWGHDNNVSDDKSKLPQIISKSMPDFTNPNFVFTIQRHNNDNGPSHFYYSVDKGKSWEGAFWFPEMGTSGVASRTDYIVDGEKEISAFITVAKANKQEGRVALARTYDGGVNWNIVSWIGDEHKGFDIMPSSVRLSSNKLFTVIRTRTAGGRDLLTSYLSQDNGKSWNRLPDPIHDAGRGGTPPALVQLKDGRLALSYIYRSENGSRVNLKISSDEGLSWGDEIVVRAMDGANRDCGYPRMVQREDGGLVIIYYWNNVHQRNAKPYRYIASTIVDPNDYR